MSIAIVFVTMSCERLVRRPKPTNCDFPAVQSCNNHYEEMVRERYSHIEAGELGDVATEALEEIDTVDESVSPSGHSPHDFSDSE